MNCEELQQNTAAYALGALTPDEASEFERHLIECDLEHEVDVFSDVVSKLSYAAPSIEPPAGLRDRILAAAEADVASDAFEHEDAGRQNIGQSSSGGFVTWLRGLSAPAYGAAAAFLILIGAFVGWGVASISGDDDPVSVRHFHREEDGDWFRVETQLGREGMTLSVGNLDRLSGQSYQFWAVREEQWLPVGDFNTNPEGRWSGDFQFALEQGDSIAITVEPEGGSESPSTEETEIRSRI